jgi:hypothetical protein
MSVTLSLPPDLEQWLREKAAQCGQTLEAYLQGLAEQALQAEAAPALLPRDQRVAAWRVWVASHAWQPTIADDSRESIYAGRGE